MDLELQELTEENQILNDYKHEYNNDDDDSDEYKEKSTIEETTTENELEEQMISKDDNNNKRNENNLSKTYNNPDIQFIDTLFYILESRINISSSLQVKHNILIKLSSFYEKRKKKY